MNLFYLDYPKLVRMRSIIGDCHRLTFHLTQLKSKPIFSMSTGSHLYGCHYHLLNHLNSVNIDICGLLVVCFRCYGFVSGICCILCLYPLCFLGVGALIVIRAPIILYQVIFLTSCLPSSSISHSINQHVAYRVIILNDNSNHFICI